MQGNTRSSDTILKEQLDATTTYQYMSSYNEEDQNAWSDNTKNLTSFPFPLWIGHSMLHGSLSIPTDKKREDVKFDGFNYLCFC